MLNFRRIDDEERLLDLRAQLLKAQDEYRAVLFKLLKTTDEEEHYWRRMELWHSGLYVTRLKYEIAALEKYLNETDNTLLITEGVTLG